MLLRQQQQAGLQLIAKPQEQMMTAMQRLEIRAMMEAQSNTGVRLQANPQMPRMMVSPVPSESLSPKRATGSCCCMI